MPCNVCELRSQVGARIPPEEWMLGNSCKLICAWPKSASDLSSSVAQQVVSEFQIAEEYPVLLDHLIRTFDLLLGSCIRYGSSQ